MCWRCDRDDARTLLQDGVAVYKEGELLKRQGVRIQAQAHGLMDSANALRDEDPWNLCREVKCSKE